jgi:predicted secreted protein
MKALESIFRAHGRMLAVATLAAGLTFGWANTALCADKITDDNVEAAVAAASTAEDHQALAAYFTAKSEEALANVQKHKRMANLVQGKEAGWPAHCQKLVKTYQEQARDYAELAKVQAALAKGIEQGK